MSDSPLRPLALVTGASSGIGYELVKQFLSGGFDVLAVAEDARIHDVAVELAGGGAAVDALQVDLSRGEEIERLAAAVAATGRPLEAAALNAGLGHAGRFADTDLAGDLEVIAVNVTSTVHLAKRLLPAMVERGAGRLLFTASVASVMPGPFYATYAASKAFVLSFAEALRQEVKDQGVTVTALMPGPTDTEFFDRAGMQGTPADEGKKDDPGRVARDGFEALMAGDDHVAAGSLMNKLQTVAAKALPEPVKAALHGRLTKPSDDD